MERYGREGLDCFVGDFSQRRKGRKEGLDCFVMFAHSQTFLARTGNGGWRREVFLRRCETVRFGRAKQSRSGFPNACYFVRTEGEEGKTGLLRRRLLATTEGEERGTGLLRHVCERANIPRKDGGKRNWESERIA